MRVGEDCGAAEFGGGGNGRRQRDAREALDAGRPDRPLVGNLREHVDVVAAVRAVQAGHILDAAQDAHAVVHVHRDRLLRVEVGQVLGCDDDDDPVERKAAGDELLQVGGAGRQVDDEVVERTPVDSVDEAVEEQLHHRCRHRDRLVLGDQELRRHDLDAVARNGLRALLHERRVAPDIDALGGMAAREAHHQREIGTVDVRVEQTDALFPLGQREGEVEAHCRLPDAALAADDGDDPAGRRHSVA